MDVAQLLGSVHTRHLEQRLDPRTERGVAPRENVVAHETRDEIALLRKMWHAVVQCRLRVSDVMDVGNAVDTHAVTVLGVGVILLSPEEFTPVQRRPQRGVALFLRGGRSLGNVGEFV